jgi:hypothetical protein
MIIPRLATTAVIAFILDVRKLQRLQICGDIFTRRNLAFPINELLGNFASLL